ncbi:MAG TPA: alpha/beta hydrolase [Pseudonocardiaceae bacterium]|jgi:pimeloyl-ACP methyl ester carboxylesterase|nr:alpha/beta hydrolase [Pseudonocardiaceae bacterium]
MTATQFLDRDGGRIAYDDTATDGPLVVCVPGLGDTRDTYRHLRPLLVAAGYRVVTMDLRGEGESTANFADYSTTAVAADIIALVRQLGVGPALLISNSYTGGPSFVVAAQAPELFTALVLTDPFARVLPGPNFVTRLAIWYVSHVVSGWTGYWTTLFPGTRPADFAESKKALAATMREPGRMAALRGMLSSPQAPGEAAAPNVTCPVLVVMGTKDKDFEDPAGEAKIIAGMVANGRVAMIENAGHYPSAQYPQATADVVLPFLAATRQ